MVANLSVAAAVDNFISNVLMCQPSSYSISMKDRCLSRSLNFGIIMSAIYSQLSSSYIDI